MVLMAQVEHAGAQKPPMAVGVAGGCNNVHGKVGDHKTLPYYEGMLGLCRNS